MTHSKHLEMIFHGEYRGQNYEDELIQEFQQAMSAGKFGPRDIDYQGRSIVNVGIVPLCYILTHLLTILESCQSRYQLFWSPAESRPGPQIRSIEISPIHDRLWFQTGHRH